MLDIADLFPGARAVVYLNTASQALGNTAAANALGEAVAAWTDGRFDWVQAEQRGEELRALAAGLLDTHPDNMALTAGAAGGAATVAAQLGPATTGANIVVPEHDFASNFVAWMLLREKGYELRLVAGDAEGAYTIDAFASNVDAGTAVVATSLVQSATGYRVDLDRLKQLAADHGAWLVLDASQAFGAIEFDLTGVTAVFSCSHKWSLGTRGLGHLYVEPSLRDLSEPVMPGWKAVSDPLSSFYGPDLVLTTTAAKLDVSWPWFNPIADLEGMRIVRDVGVAAIETHNMQLVEALVEGGCELAFSPERRSSIVSLAVADPDRLAAGMRASGMVASLRAGRVRVSFHLYNTIDDVARLLALLDA